MSPIICRTAFTRPYCLPMNADTIIAITAIDRKCGMIRRVYMPLACR